MKVYTYSEARQRLANILNIARTEEVIIKRRGGETFSIIFRKSAKSPFDVPGIKTKATTNDILDAVKESRERFAEKIDGCKVIQGDIP
jgi:prevent-host-death family protein